MIFRGLMTGSTMACALFLVGCNPGIQSQSTINVKSHTEDIPEVTHIPPDTSNTSISQEYPNNTSLNPELTPDKNANLILGGTKIPVELKETLADGKITWTWMTQGTEIEKEVYSTTPQKFALISGPAESFNPAIPLIKFPFKVGDSYSYKGSQTFGMVKREATAKITSSNDKLNLETGVYETVLVTIELNVASGTPGGTNSTFKFWFSPTKGMVKREFGFSSTRQPRKADSPPKEKSSD